MSKKKAKKLSQGKNWLHYITEGAQFSMNTTGDSNFITSKGKKKQPNVSINSAQIIEHMKRQNLNSETLHRLLV